MVGGKQHSSLRNDFLDFLANYLESPILEKKFTRIFLFSSFVLFAFHILGPQFTQEISFLSSQWNWESLMNFLSLGHSEASWPLSLSAENVEQICPYPWTYVESRERRESKGKRRDDIAESFASPTPFDLNLIFIGSIAFFFSGFRYFFSCKWQFGDHDKKNSAFLCFFPHCCKIFNSKFLINSQIFINICLNKKHAHERSEKSSIQVV